MFSPQSGNNEFVELYNLSDSAINLSGYKIQYYTSNNEEITDAGFGMQLSPNSYAVIFEGDYDIASGIYSSLVPPDALILKISDNSFGSSGMSNSSDRPVRIINPSGDTTAVYNYSADNSSAISDEKIFLNTNDTPGNWINSTETNGTPGGRNTSTPFNFDLSISALQLSVEFPVQNTMFQITSIIKNIGINSAQNFTVTIFNDVNFDSAGTADEIILTQNFASIPPQDSQIALTNYEYSSAGLKSVISEVYFNQDENLNNNKKLLTFQVLPPGNNYKDVVINEIMYAPSSGQPEWIELMNNSDNDINLIKWNVSDNSSSASITNSDVIISPGEFIVISRDSSIKNFYDFTSKLIITNIPSLNNTGDAIVIKDTLNVILDSLEYLPNWGGANGYSLERISPGLISTDQTSWKTSSSRYKATPGYINSVTQKDYNLTLTKFFTDNNYAVIGEAANLYSLIKNNGNNSGNFSLNIFYDANQDSIPQPGELLEQLQAASLLPGDSIIIPYSSQNIIEGENLFFAEILFPQDQDTSDNKLSLNINGVNVNEERNDIVINEIMYAPSAGQPEWIEFYNKSGKIIDLKNYKIADNTDTTAFINTSLQLLPQDYLVLSADSSIKNFYDISSKLIFKNFSSLNNSGDKIIILDSLNRVIDSLQYFSGWGGNGEKSLEKIAPFFSSIDSASWSTSTSKYNATPGFINSVSEKEFDLEAVDIIFNPPFPIFGDDVNLSVKVKNNGNNSAEFLVKLLEDTDLDSTANTEFFTTSPQILIQKDSIIIPMEYSVQNLLVKKGFYAEIVFTSDEDTSNNSVYKTLSAGYPRSTILVNEIMYSPSGNEPEWIEFFNTSSDSINLKDWKISDALSTPSAVKINNDFFVKPGEFFIAAKDSSIINFHRAIPSEILEINFSNLNNDADGVILYDNRGQQMDSVLFNSDWGGSGGISLERIALSEPSTIISNWGSSKDPEGSSPGRINSITRKENDLVLSDIIFNPRFPVFGDDVFLSAKINNLGINQAENFQINFYADLNFNGSADEIIFSTNISLLNSGDSIFSVSDVPVKNLQQNILVAARIFFTVDEDTFNNYIQKELKPGVAEKTILINEIMYDPINGEPEWFEIINASSSEINLNDWLVSDVSSPGIKSSIINYDFFLHPNELLVIAKDSSIIQYHSNIENYLTVNFSSLSSANDGIILYDFREGIIDSVNYKSSWGGRNGYSLERISVNGLSNESSNWTSSLSPNRSTPAEINSIYNIPDYQKNSIIINEILFDPDDDNSEFIEFYNNNDAPINIGGWHFEDQNGNFYKISDTSFIIPPKEYFLAAADSIILTKYQLENFSNKNILNISNLGLSNSGELILLKDIRGNVIDSIFYSDNWHNKNLSSTKNISLERINTKLDGNLESNWSSSVSESGATPGKTNSIFTENLLSTSNISVSPNPFSPDDDGFEDFCIINYNLTQAISQVRIKVYDSRGRLVRTLINDQGSASNGSIIFNGKDDEGNSLRIGIYIIFLEAINQSSGVVENLKSVVVVARKL